MQLPRRELVFAFELRQALPRVSQQSLDLVEQPLVRRAATQSLVARDLVAKPSGELVALHIPSTGQGSIRCTFKRGMRKPPSWLDL